MYVYKDMDKYTYMISSKVANFDFNICKKLPKTNTEMQSCLQTAAEGNARRDVGVNSIRSKRVNGIQDSEIQLLDKIR